MPQLPHNSYPRRPINVLLLVVAAILLLLALTGTDLAPLHNDFVEYWSAAHLLLSGRDPYSPAAMLQVELATGFQGKQALLMWNPPWALPFVLPLGLLSYSHASSLWLLLSLIVVFASADWLWRAYGGDPKRRWLAWLLAATFFPLLAAMGLGQIGPLILLGITLFLRFHRSRPLLAGAATVLIAVKPQLLFLFWIVLLLQGLCGVWIPLAGAALGLGLLGALPLLLSHSVWSSYLHLARGGTVLRYPSPTFGTLLRAWLGDKAWLQFVPPLIGAVWAVLFWTRRRRRWSWQLELPLLLLVSLVTTAYGWLFDQIVLLPVMMQVAVPLARCRRRLWVSSLAGYAAASAVMVLFLIWRKTGTAYTWTAPAWLLMYLSIRSRIVRESSCRDTARSISAAQPGVGSEN